MTVKQDKAHEVMLKGVRLSMFNDQIYYPEVEQTTKGKHKGKFRYNWSSRFILPPKDSREGRKLLAQIRTAMVAAKENKWKEQADKIRIKSSATPLQDGDHEDVTFSAYNGSYVLSASKTVYGQKDGEESDIPRRPFRVIGPRRVKGPDGELRFPDVTPGEEGAPYSGCYVNVKVEFWGQEADGERGIPNRLNATILAIQFAKHGDAFGGGGTRVNVEDEFDDEFDEDDDDLDVGGDIDDEDDDDLGI